MAIFLVLTIIYHLVMRQALKQLTTYLPDSLQPEHQIAMFTTTDTHSYDYTSAGAPPSEVLPVPPTGFASKKAALFSKIFNPQKFASFHKAQTLVPKFPLPRYEEDEEKHAYFNPLVRSEPPRLWIVRDEMGISAREVRDSSEVVEIGDEGARFNEKGKIVWDEQRLEEVPVWEKRVDY